MKSAVTYVWRKEDKSKGAWHYLLPTNARGVACISSIASVQVYTEMYPKRRLLVTARYNWSSSSGNKPQSFAELGSVAAAKRWVETELAKFWEPPTLETCS